MKKIMILIFLSIMNIATNASYQPYYQPAQIQQNQMQVYYQQPQHYYNQRIIHCTTIMHVHPQQRQSATYNYYPSQLEIEPSSPRRPQITQTANLGTRNLQGLHNRIPVIAMPLDEESTRIQTDQAENTRNQIPTEITPQDQATEKQTTQSVIYCLLCCCKKA